MANRTKFAGWYRALDYFYGRPNGSSAPPPLLIQTAPGATGAGSVTVQGAQMILSDGTVAYPLATNASVLVGSGSNQETVTPSAVSNPTSPVPGVGGFTATFSNLHGVGDPVASATCGLQEAINDANTNGGGTVVVDAAWRLAGGTDAMILAATLPTNGTVGLLDNRNGQGSIQTYTKTLTNAQTLALNSAPVSLLAAPGTTSAYDIIDCVFINNFATAAFAAGGAIQLSYGTGVTIPATATVAATFLTSPVASQMIKVAGALASNLRSDIVNKAIFVAAATADFTTGGGTLTLKIAYRTLTGI